MLQFSKLSLNILWTKPSDECERYIEEKDAGSNFSFKCHRQDQNGAKDQQLVFAVNAITFHQGYGTFSTAGADGTINFWDKDSKTRLKSALDVIVAWCFYW